MCIDTSNVFWRIHEIIQKYFALLLTGVMTVNMGCGMHNETSRKIICKERDEVEADVEAYLEEKYGKAFVVAVTDNPNHIYSSYAGICIRS